MATHNVVAIHQPNFFPWLGYFNKIAQADVFIVLDDVQQTKTGSNWSNRVKLFISAEARWVTAPISRPAHGTIALNQVEWANLPWREKLLKTLATNYQVAPFYDEAMRLLRPLIVNPEPNLAGYNLHAIRAIVSALGLRTDLMQASQFAVSSASTQRLIDLTRAVGCTGYMAGGGAANYQDDALFARAGLTVKFQSFVHPVYSQAGAGEFTPGLSVIDALMHCGLARTSQLILA